MGRGKGESVYIWGGNTFHHRLTERCQVVRKLILMLLHLGCHLHSLPDRCLCNHGLTPELLEV